MFEKRVKKEQKKKKELFAAFLEEEYIFVPRQTNPFQESPRKRPLSEEVKGLKKHKIGRIVTVAR